MALAEADYSLTEMAFTGEQGGPRPGDEKLLVRFSTQPFQNQQKSKEEGRPIYEDVTFVDIRIPGDRLSHILRPANGGDYDRFPKHYEAYQSRTSDQDQLEGTPLIEWPMCSRSQAEELAYFHVRTVEQLADMSDGNIGKFMGAATLRQKAETWLASTKDTKAAQELTDKINAKDAEILALKETQTALMARLDKLEAD